MRALAWLGLLCACGGYTPQSFCQASNQASCQKIFQCNAPHPSFASEADCEQQKGMAVVCANIADGDVCSSAGGAFDPAGAARCISDLQALSCDAVKSSNFILPSTCLASAYCD
jgi:hypothetical protein